ncbi:MAG TPA: phosphatase PAP2 family protein [Vicinamibacterales bacterium]|nr:phosphatase PAP2 family protein [Vicinamibacterales bacterium]
MLRAAGIAVLIGVWFTTSLAAQDVALDTAEVVHLDTPLVIDPSAVDTAVGVDDGVPPQAKAFAFGQVIGKPTPAPPTPAHTGIKEMIKELGIDIKHLPSWENVFWAGVGGGAAAAVHPLDPTTNADLSGPFLNKFFAPGAIMGQSYTLLPVSATIYAIGRATDHPQISHMGSDLIQSIAIAELMTQSIKYSVRRERPNGSGANSFPSGHAADTMAFATALERHLNWKYYAPAYALATYVAMSRLHDNVHYVSDVAFGASVGIIAGRTVTRTGHHPFPVAMTAVPRGFEIVYMRQSDEDKP